MLEKYKAEDSSEVQGIAEVLSYLEMKYHSLANDYTKDGHTEHCGLIAVDIVRLFIKSGLKPQIFSIVGKVVDSAGNRETFYPRRYSNRVSWEGHTVCVLNGVVYDPMVGTPVPLDEYARITFSKEVDMYVYIDSDEITEFVSPRK